MGRGFAEAAREEMVAKGVHRSVAVMAGSAWGQADGDAKFPGNRHPVDIRWEAISRMAAVEGVQRSGGQRVEQGREQIVDRGWQLGADLFTE